MKIRLGLLLFLLLLLIGCGNDQPLIPDLSIHNHNHDQIIPGVGAPSIPSRLPRVKIFYVEPTGEAHSEAKENEIEQTVLDSQRFFADQFTCYGLERTSFRINGERNNFINRVHIDYSKDRDQVSDSLISSFVDYEKRDGIYIYFVNWDTKGRGFASGYPDSGMIYLPKRSWNTTSFMHEIGHLAGLGHDWRNGQHIMSYNFTLNQDGSLTWHHGEPKFFSPGAAFWMSSSIFSEPEIQYIFPFYLIDPTKDIDPKINKIERTEEDTYYIEVSVNGDHDTIYDYARLVDTSKNIETSSIVLDYIYPQEIRWNATKKIYELRFSSEIPITVEKIGVAFQNRHGQVTGTEEYDWPF